MDQSNLRSECTENGSNNFTSQCTENGSIKFEISMYSKMDQTISHLNVQKTETQGKGVLAGGPSSVLPVVSHAGGHLRCRFGARRRPHAGGSNGILLPGLGLPASCDAASTFGGQRTNGEGARMAGAPEDLRRQDAHPRRWQRRRKDWRRT